MTVAKALERVSVATFPIPVTLSSRRLPEVDVEELRIKFVVPDRETGKQTDIYSIHDYDGVTPAEVWVFDRVLWMLRHELEEHYFVDGVRVRDPHANEAIP